jgi:hypothetical protein
MKHGGLLWIALAFLICACEQPTGTTEYVVIRESAPAAEAEPAHEPAVAPEPVAEPAAEPVVAPDPVVEPETAPEPAAAPIAEPEPEEEPEPLPPWRIADGKLWRSDDGVSEYQAGAYGDWWFTEGSGVYRVWVTHIQMSPTEELFFLWLAEYRITGTGYEKIMSVDDREIGGTEFSVSGGVLSAGSYRFALSAAGFEEVVP